jgi:hypothetical protein
MLLIIFMLRYARKEPVCNHRRFLVRVIFQKSMRHLSFIDPGQPGRQCDSAVAAGRRWLPTTPNLTGSLAFALVSKLSQVHVMGFN